MLRVVTVILALALVLTSAASARRPDAASGFAEKEIARVVAAGLMAPSVDTFRPDDLLTESELATVVASLGGAISVADPDAPVRLRELHARLVSLAGLRTVARDIRLAAAEAGLAPHPWLGTETVARLLGLRFNHPRGQDELEPQVTGPVSRAEAAYSVAVYLGLDDAEVEAVRVTAESFSLGPLTGWQRLVLTRALRFVGSPYVWAGTSELPQRPTGRDVPGGFDCSGFVWRVYKMQPFADAPQLARVLTGRTTYAMSSEVAQSARISRAALQPGDVAFFGSRGVRSLSSEVGHMGIYLGNGWLAHSSRLGTTLTPMSGWYETTFAWGRSPLVEAGLEY
jgi:hypothetical protein